MLLLLAACTAPPDPADDSAPTDSAPADSGDSAEVVPGDSSDTGEAPRTLTAPATVTLDCTEAIPVEGKVDCTIRIAWPEGDVVYEGHAGVGIHGRSSSGFPKHQYAVELRDDKGQDLATDLFGMGADADWLLNGMYLDRALFRNKLAYDLYREMGDVAPEAAYCEMTLNGAYSGVYLLTERVEQGPERVDIPDDDGTGASFIVRADESGLPSRVQYAHWAPVYPDALLPGESARIAAFEDAILGDGSAIFTEADLDGYVDFVILEETLKNNDAYYLSHHLYTGADGKLRFVPWDLDLTLGQPSYNNNERSDLWILYRPDIVARPALQKAFRDRFVARWTELRSGILSDAAMVARMEGYRAFLGPAIARNWAAWDITAVENVGFPLYHVGSADEEYAAVEAFIVARLAWIDANVGAY